MRGLVSGPSADADVAMGLKAMEEKALEGRTPTRVRFGDRALASACPLRRSKQACSSFDWSFPFPEVIRAVPLRRSPIRIADTEKPLKPRRSRVRAEPGNGRRGEAPRGVPRAGRSKTLKGEPHGCWAVDGPSSGAIRVIGPTAYVVGAVLLAQRFTPLGRWSEAKAADSGRAGSKSSRGYSNPEGGRCRELELPG